MSYSIQHIAGIISADAQLHNESAFIEHLLIDSRRVIFPQSSLFFALQTTRRNGEDFVEELYDAGVRSFVVTDSFTAIYPDANILKVAQPLQALQALSAYHRSQFKIPVAGITGSNGKTIVKEWLYQLLHADYNIVRSPKSYNSQIGVPLSVWQMNHQHTLALFEAGISQQGEMAALHHVIRPTIGVLTNIGAAHAAGFTSEQQKLEEKWKLFEGVEVVICPSDVAASHTIISDLAIQKLFTWGWREGSDVLVRQVHKVREKATIEVQSEEEKISIEIPFSDDASIENALTCLTVLLYLGVDRLEISQRMRLLQPVEMRLQLKKGINNCSVINDSYSNDISSLRIALNFLRQQTGKQLATVILSDLGEETGDKEQYLLVLEALLQHNINKFVGIGPRLFALQHLFKEHIPNSFFYPSVEDFRSHFIHINFRDEVILLKGARSFRFEDINLLFEQKVHQTVLEVNLSSMIHNLKEYQRFLKPDTKVMAMVKAFSYGSGSAEIASVLQYHKVDYLAVAYADEGVELRKAGIKMPIMVMNPEEITFPSLVDYNLEPELYSFHILSSFSSFLEQAGLQQYPVHIKIDTGMHRLGFEVEHIDALCESLQPNKHLYIKSVFSHLAGSEDPQHDTFTAQQAEKFLWACKNIELAIGYSFIRHVANSAAIFRHPYLQYEMVRLGIGLYGVDSSAEHRLSLLPVATLKTTIAQVREVKQGESIGYSRRGVVTRDSRIATLRIGYADGFSRRLGNGKGFVSINGQLAPVVGNVCMDMIMIDVTNVEVDEGDEAEVFGLNLAIEQVAHWCETIPYEIMTGISQRVKREYYLE